MPNERLHIRISTEQKRRLEAAARAPGESVSGLVRAAIDECYGKRKYKFSQAKRKAAMERIRSGPTIPFITPEELNRITEETSAERFLPREGAAPLLNNEQE
jgi:predicted transcriptional regulator